jgi:hypothetical protein
MCTLGEGADPASLINRDQNDRAAPSICVRRVTAHAGEGQRQMVLARINIAFAQDTREAAIRRVRRFGNIIA